MIREIHCFGTSFTAGGGFEFDSPIKQKTLLENYSEEPLTQFNYSYPGQLQNLVGDSIKVFNHGKSGFGNDRMYRKTFEVIENSDTLDDKVFIYEFSGLQRKEIYSNTFKKHLIVNYAFEDDGSNSISGISDEYFITSVNVESTLKPIIEPYFKETINFFVEQNLIDQQQEFFIDYLIHNKINFLVVEQPKYKKTNDKTKPYTIDFGMGIVDMVHFSANQGLTISNETNGKIIDEHGGFKWSKHIAKKIAIKLTLIKNNNFEII